jgi:PEGA domain
MSLRPLRRGNGPSLGGGAMRSQSVLVVSFGVVLVGIAVSGAGRAQPPSAAPPKAPAPRVEATKAAEGDDSALRTAEARRRYQEGNAAVKIHLWQKAYDAYLAAWRLRPHWQVAGSLGQVELKLGKSRDAALHLSLFLREAQDVPPEEMKRVSEWLDQARNKIAVLTIGGAPSGAEILLDGLKVGQAPLREEVYVEPGKHVVEGHLGQCAATSEVDLAAGSAREVALRCASPGAARPGDVTASLSSAPADAPLGAKRSSLAPTAPLIVGSSVTAAALGLGIASIALFTARGNKAEANHENASGANTRAEATFKNVAVWSFVTAGLVGAGTILYQVKREKSSRPPVRGDLFVGPAGGTVVLQGEF